MTPVLRAMLITRSFVLIRGIFEDAQADSMYAETLATFQAAGDMSGLALALLHRGQVLWNTREPDFTQATQLFEEALALCRKLGEHHGIAAALHGAWEYCA